MQRIKVAIAILLAAALAVAVTAQTTPRVYKGGKSSKSSKSKSSKSSKSAKSATVKRKTTTAKSKSSTTHRTVAKAGSKTRPKTNTPPRPRGQLRPSQERYKEIEQALAARGYLEEEPSGKWGDGSVQALRAFQTDHQLPPTGKLDSLSLIQLGLGPRM